MSSLYEIVRAELLRSICAVACRVLEARAASVALFDEASADFVFVAAVGEGAGDLVGARFPADEGIAGHVRRTGEPIEVADLYHEPRFARAVAVETRYEPDAIAVAPLRGTKSVLGVLSVLDPARTPPGGTPATLVSLADHAVVAMGLAAALTE